MNVRSVDYLSEKKKVKKKNGNVPVAGTSTLEKDSPSEAVPQNLSEEQVQETGAEERSVSMPFDISQVDPEKLRMAEELGIPVREIISWAISVEERFKTIEEQMPEVVERAMARAVQKARERAMSQPQPPVRGGRQGFGAEDIFTLLFSGGGGGADEEMIALTKDMMRLNIESMKADLGFTKAIKNAFVTRITGETVETIMPKK